MVTRRTEVDPACLTHRSHHLAAQLSFGSQIPLNPAPSTAASSRLCAQPQRLRWSRRTLVHKLHPPGGAPAPSPGDTKSDVQRAAGSFKSAYGLLPAQPQRPFAPPQVMRAQPQAAPAKPQATPALPLAIWARYASFALAIPALPPALSAPRTQARAHMPGSGKALRELAPTRHTPPQPTWRTR